MKSVDKYQQSNYLSEIMQHNNTEFALCRYDNDSKLIIQCHQFVHCRDYMHDAFVSVESNRPMSVWGFCFDKKNPRPDAEIVSILLKFPNAGILKHFQDNFQILKDIEDCLGYMKSCAEFVEYPGQNKVPILWILGDPSWQRNAVSFSLYTYILKCLGYRITNRSFWMEEIAETKVNGKQTNEAQYMNIDWISWLLYENGLNQIKDYYHNYSGWNNQEKIEAYRIHEDSGFVTIGNTFWKGNHLADFTEHCLYGFKIHKAAA